ncbi:hypothetical protein BKA62DRAFT_697347 [Auriculariales sp. MPI-PUGE-AT-0066]|nr:hypothetical protein BKA62DRAFT_697347 [Auriculariales sp. MPI-PUGE-AT-0066]
MPQFDNPAADSSRMFSLVIYPLAAPLHLPSQKPTFNMPDSQATGPHFSAPVLAAVVGVAIPTYLLLKRVFRRHIVFTSTVLADIPTLGRPAAHKKHGTVIICGGSFAGLLTARVCADHFERVIIVEPEAWALSDEAVIGPVESGVREVVKDGLSYNTYTHKRARIPQYTSIHGYQALVMEVLPQLFPNIRERARERKIPTAASDMHLFLNGRLLRYPYEEVAKSGKPAPENIFCSRRALESLIRSLVKEHAPNVEYVNGTVADLKLDEKRGTIRAASVRLLGEEAHTKEIACDMLVDCTGNTQAGLKWLARVLPAAAAERLANIRQEYDPNINYSTMEWPAPPRFDENLRKIDAGFRISADGSPQRVDLAKEAWFFGYGPTAASGDFRMIFGGRRENGGIVFAGGGWDSDLPVTSEQLRVFAQAMKQDRPVPKYFFDIMDLLEEVDDKAVCYEAKIRSCSRVLYETVGDVLPSNFVALGDATMRLNPRAGEGVTKCSMGVTTLDGVLRRHARGPQDAKFGATFFKLLASRTQGVWDGARLADYGYDTTTPVKGETHKTGGFIRWYTSVIARVAERDRAVGWTLWNSAMFLAPGLDILAPSIVFKVLWEAVFPTKVSPTAPYLL